ncbi:MAG TPA: ABC transporter substrate-binding protein, partial [Opitutales bacterium]|nr:ABC transporter substrate-binding protein [Opitutales bacterium]
MERILQTTGFFLLFLLLPFLSGCFPSEQSRSKPEAFVFASGSDAQKLDPADVDDGESVNTLAQICEGLVRFRSGTLEIEPALAESYEISEDGMTYTFQLREGVSFHDGTPLDAEAAVFSFQRQIDSDHPGHLSGSNFQYWNYLYQDVKSVEATAPMTVEFQLHQPNASLLNSLAIFPAFLLSPASFEKYGAEVVRNPVGTGPYRFVRWLPNEAIVLERNPDYWGEPAEFEQLIFKVVPDNTVRVLELRSGQVHAIDGVQPAELPGLANDPRFTIYREPGLNVGYLTFAETAVRLAEPEIREAIAWVIDREKLAEVALDQSGSVAHYPLPPGSLGLPEKEVEIPYDPEAAREVLARYSDRWQTPLRLHAMTAPRAYFPDSVRAASLIREDLAKVGLQVEIVARDFKSHLDALRNGDFEMALIGWIGDNGDTDNFLSIFFGSWAAEKGAATNFAFYKNDEMDHWLYQGRKETDPAKRQEIYEKALALWRRDLPLIPLVHGDTIV